MSDQNQKTEPQSAPTANTAKVLGAFFKELQAEGFSPDAAYDLVRAAYTHGLQVVVSEEAVQ